MHVAFFMNRFPEPSETFIMNAAAGLIDAGCDIDIYGLQGMATSTARHAMLERYGLMARAYPPQFADSRKRRRWLEAPAALGRVALRSGWRNAASALNVAVHKKRALGGRTVHEVEAFRQRDYDVLHCHFATLAEPVLRHRRAGGLDGAVVVHFRGYDITTHVHEFGTTVYDAAFRDADQFIANSMFFRNRAIDLGCPPERITVIESAVNLTLFPFAPRMAPINRPVRLLTVGRLVEKKGIADAIAATARLRDQGLSIEHDIIGEGYERPTLERLIAQHGLGGVVTLRGERSQEEIAAALAAADLFVAPSVTARDGASDAAINTLKEAMATGLPVVSTWHGGIPELVEDGVSGYLVAERDPAALADRLADLIADPDRWAAMGAAGRAAVEHRFTFTAIARQTLDIYQSAIYLRKQRARRHEGLR